MKFKDYEYKRPDLSEAAKEIKELTEEIKNAKSIEAVKNIINKVQAIKDEVSSLETIASIRNSINTIDEFYEKEMDYFSENTPVLTSAITEYSKVLINSKHRAELEKTYGVQWFKAMELSSKTYDDKISEELVLESKLTIEYSKIMASAKIEFDGKINNLSQMFVYLNSKDRKIRHQAYLKNVEFLESIEEKVDELYDELVKVRTQMAKKMGYENYVEFGYLRLGRSDYNSKDVANYRKQVAEFVVPVAVNLFEEQKKRIGIADFKSYDIPVFYKEGNPIPTGTTDDKISSAKKMYSELSLETKEFFNYMTDNELMDLDSKAGKQGGGYCTIIPTTKSPFIFSNFNGTSGDVDVLTHEAGHAFQVYTASRLLDIADIYWPTMEACEIHSMSMEFFTHPWMNLFFGDDAKRYYYQHLVESITFIPYGVSVDEFQHFVYENPEATPQMRKDKWREIERKYTPWKDYDNVTYYERGSYWHRQGHIFSTPFYYIDYTLAQVCAFQFYLKDLENHDDAWKTYVELCKLGGSKSFIGLLDSVNLKNPFKDGFLKNMMPKIEAQAKKLESDL